MSHTVVASARAGSLAFSAEGSVAAFTGEGVSTASRGRFWTMSLIHDDDRDCPAHSEDQSPALRPTPGGGLDISYASVRCAHGIDLEVVLTITVTAEAEALSFRAQLGAGPGVLIRELALPVIELDRDTAHDDEVLYRAEGLGRRIDDPRRTLYRAHTEYMADDSLGVWEGLAYPGEFSMPWQCVTTPGGVLYLGRHDPEFSSAILSAGVPPRGSEGELWLSVVSPVGRSSFVAPQVVVSLEPGDWKLAAARYRAWANTWYTGPHPSTRPIQGWQRLIMRHQFGEIYLRYSDLVDAFETGRKHGLDGILLFAWWAAGMDRGYPYYEPDPALGGADELRAAIAEIRSRGGVVWLYANGNLIDREVAYPLAREVAKKDERGLEQMPGYSFARESQTLRHFSANGFVIACHGAPAWRQQMADVARVQAGLGTDGIFFDQTAYHLAAWPCYDSSHEHGERIGIESTFRRQTLEELRQAAAASSLGSEGMADCMIPVLNFHHGWGFAFHDEPEAFPALFRTVFPEPVVSNRLIHDERAGWQDQLNYAFVYNLSFDVAIHRARATIDTVPDYADRIGRLAALRQQHGHFFDGGRFEFVSRTAALTHVRYTVDRDALDVFWNHGDDVQSAGDIRVGAHDVAVATVGAPGLAG